MKIKLLILFFTLIALQAHAQQTHPSIQKITLKEWEKEAKTNTRLLPKYGEIPKTEEQIKADAELIDTYVKQQGSRRKASDLLIGLGFSHLYRQDIKTAMYRFNQAWLLDSTNVDVYWGYGGVYSTLGDTQSALDQYDQGLSIDPKSSKILTDKATIYMMQGQTTGDKDKLNKAIELFKASYDVDPKYQSTLYKLSVCYFIQNDCANAKKYYNECKELGGKNITQGYTDALVKKCP